MATDRCVELLLDSKDFKALPAEGQATRLATFLSAWFEPGHSLHTVDGVRLSQRIRAYVAGSGSSVGAVMLDLLANARSIHEQTRPATHPEPVEESVVESVTRVPRARSKSKIKSTVAR